MRSADAKVVIGQTGPEPIRLEYAASVTPGWRPTILQARHLCLLTAGVSVLLGLIVPEDIGSGRVILNPLRILMVGALYSAVAIYVALRIFEDRRSPFWSRVA
jgi:hypothetical protein